MDFMPQKKTPRSIGYPTAVDTDRLGMLGRETKGTTYKNSSAGR
jgi:hypothetical protein